MILVSSYELDKGQDTHTHAMDMHAKENNHCGWYYAMKGERAQVCFVDACDEKSRGKWVKRFSPFPAP